MASAPTWSPSSSSSESSQAFALPAASGDPAAEILPWTGLSLFLALAGLFLFVALPNGERAQAAEASIGADEELELVRGLAELRRAVVAYRVDHGTWPGNVPLGAQADDAAAWFERQLLHPTDGAGLCSMEGLPSYPFGPYLEGERLPRNAANGLSSMRTLRASEAMPTVPDGTTGWIFDPRSGELRANSPGRVASTGHSPYEL